MSDYWLTKHAYLCTTEDHVVILDLRKDRYLALSHRQSDALNVVVTGWPRHEISNTSDDTANADETVTRLLKANLITNDLAFGKDATPTSYVAPIAPLLETALLHTLLVEAPRPPRITVGDALHLTSAYLTALLNLRFRSLERLINSVNARRVTKSRGLQPDIQAARALVTKFRLMRSLFYTARGKCLLDSYVLLEFLAKYHIYPAWIFAVQTRPFRAHCWLQQDNLVFNDTIEHVGTYVPIMVA